MSNIKIDLKKNELKPFFDADKIVLPNTNILNILSNENYGLPLIPGMYFGQNSIKSKIDDKQYIVGYDNIGSNILSNYNNIKNSLEKLESIKSFIVNILNSNSYTLKPIKVSKEKYKLSKKHLLYLFNENLNQSFVSLLNTKKPKSTPIKSLTNKVSNKFKNAKSFIYNRTSVLRQRTNNAQRKIINASRHINNLTNELNKKILGRNSSQKIKNSVISGGDKNDKKTISFQKFIEKFSKNNFNLLKKTLNTNDNPYFMFIFQNEYKAKNKAFFYKLFSQYVSERQKLLKFIKNNNGILAFSYMFDMTYRSINASNNDDTTKKSKNQKKYRLLEPYYKPKNNSTNTNFNVGDIVNITQSNGTKKKATITQIDFVNIQKKPYQIEYENGTTGDVNVENISEISKKAKPTLSSKIQKFSTLYTNFVNKDIIQNNYNKNINQTYNNFYKSLDDFISGNTEFNLLNVCVNGIETDFNLLKFIFNYVDVIMYNIVVDNDYKIKEYISNKINIFERYYEQYILWYNEMLGLVSSDILFKDTFGKDDFKEFLDKILEKQLLTPPEESSDK